MALGDWFALGICLVMVLVGIPVAVWQWRDPNVPMQEAPPVWWVWGESLWKGMLRAFPILVLMIGCATLVAFSPAPVASWPDWLRWCAASVLSVLVAIAASIVLFNQPRALVPPPRRGEDGLLRRRRAAELSTRVR
jgi:hypothetical protein